MALPYGIEPPRWMQDEVAWYRESGERSTQAFTQSLFQGAQLGMQQQRNQLEMASGMLKLQEQEQSLELGKTKIAAYSKDTDDIPAWLREHPTWESRQSSDWPVASTPEWEKRLDQIRANDGRSLQFKLALADQTEFIKGQEGILPADRAKIKALPANRDGSISEQQWNFLNESRTRAGLPGVGITTPTQTAAEKNVDAILKAEQGAAAAEASGDKEASKMLRDKAAMLRAEISGQQIMMGQDNEGRPIIRIGKDMGSPTVATQSRAQEKLLKYENSMELLTQLEKNLKPEHVGVQGAAGEMFLDRTLAQFVPGAADTNRIEARTALIAAKEGLMREISDDPRFSNMDRENIAKALPSSGVFESYPDAVARIKAVKGILANRGKVYSRGIGQKAPGWSLSKEEIRDAFQKGAMTEDEAISALTRFHIE